MTIKEDIDELVADFVPDNAHAVVAGVTSSSGSIYETAAGNGQNSNPASIDLILAFFSCSKTVTAMAVLKLWEQGVIGLDTAASEYLPLIETIGLIDPGLVSEKGEFKTPPRKPTKPITIRHLLTHTAGFAYAFSNDDYLQLARRNPGVNSVNISMDFFTTEKMPLLFEAGTKYCYGHSYDWLGLIVEAVTKQTLGEYLKKTVFEPAQLHSFTFHVKDASKMIQTMKRNKKTGELSPVRHPAVLLDPEIDMGGQGVFGSLRDFMKFLRIWLNFGYSPDGKIRILKEETVRFAMENHLPQGVYVDYEVEVPPEYQTDGQTLIGCARGGQDLATGRPSGALSWAGLANLYFWIDTKNDVAGFWATQLLPQLDIKCLMKFMQFEFCIYEHLELRNKL